MTDAEKLKAATDLLREVAAKLERMATESLNGGWSTHQVKPQRDIADSIYSTLGRIGR